MTVYYLRTESDRRLARNRLESVPADGKWQVSIIKAEKRRGAQNRLLWKWNTAIAEQTYSTKEDVHQENKLALGVPILQRDDSEFEGAWRLISDTLNAAQQLQAIHLIDVTKIMSVKQMTEYLRDLEMKYDGMGILLPKKDDEYFEALGYKRRKAA